MDMEQDKLVKNANNVEISVSKKIKKKPEELVYHHEDDEVDLLITQITRRKNQLTERMNADITLKMQVDDTIAKLKRKIFELKNRCAKREIARDTYTETIAETEEAFSKVIATADAVASMLNNDVGSDDGNGNLNMSDGGDGGGEKKKKKNKGASDGGSKKKKKKSKK